MALSGGRVMMSSSRLSILVILIACIQGIEAHMELQVPPAINSKFNLATPPASIDYSMNSPLSPDGSNWPCKGYVTTANFNSIQPVATLKSGERFMWKLNGTATHNGGSCQVGVSYDMMKTNVILASYIGGCPMDPTYDFLVPPLPSSPKAIFSWQWWNRSGNREMYQNCAIVKIDGTATQFIGPLAYRANTEGKSCTNAQSIEDVFPNPGSQVVYGGSYASGLPKAVISLSNCARDGNIEVTVQASGAAVTGEGSGVGVATGSFDTAVHALSGNMGSTNIGNTEDTPTITVSSNATPTTAITTPALGASSTPTAVAPLPVPIGAPITVASILGTSVPIATNSIPSIVSPSLPASTTPISFFTSLSKNITPQDYLVVGSLVVILLLALVVLVCTCTSNNNRHSRSQNSEYSEANVGCSEKRNKNSRSGRRDGRGRHVIIEEEFSSETDDDTRGQSKRDGRNRRR